MHSTFAILDNHGRHVGTVARTSDSTSPETFDIGGGELVTVYYVPADLLNKGDV